MSCPRSSLNKTQKGINTIQLSKNAIYLLSKQFVRDGEKRIIEEKFIFQIISSIKQTKNWYCCSLIDQNSKFGGFCIKYEDKYGIPKKGDILETNKIQIIKLPNRDNYLYFCDNVVKLIESEELMEINLKKINSLNRNNNEHIENLSNKRINFDNQFITPNKKRTNNNHSEEIDYNQENKKYTLYSEILNNINILDPIFYLKCKSKSAIKNFVLKNDNTESKRQFYYFLDTEGDLVQIVAYGINNIKYFNSIIQFGNVYEFSKMIMHQNKNDTTSIFPIVFWISKFSTIIKKMEDKGEFIKIRNINEKLITKIYDLNTQKVNINLNVVGIILEDRGIVETPNGGKKSRLIIIGDKTFHCISVSLWTNIINPERNFKKGDIIYLSNICYKENYIHNYLSAYKKTQIYFCQLSPYEQELKHFYEDHPNIYEYKELSFKYLNSKKDIPLKLISEFKKEYENQNQNNSKITVIKIRGIILNFSHKKSIVSKKCIFCNKKIESEKCDVCGNIPKLYFYFKLEIKDCSGHLLIDFFGSKAEMFLRISPEDYIKILNDNNEEKINEINKRILYKYFIFFGNYNKNANGIFSSFFVQDFGEENKESYNNLISNLVTYLN